MRAYLLLAALTLTPVLAAPPMDDLMTVRDARSRRVASNSTDPASNGDNRWIKPGASFTLADIKTPGVIRHIWITFPESSSSWISKDGCADPSEIVLRMYWDGAAEPAVESPLGDFFAAGFGRRAPIMSIPVQVQGGDSYNCYWPMPFRSAARITVTNESERPLAALYFQIDYTEEAVPADAGYFCAQYRQEFPTTRGGDYLILDAESEGGGHYVGTVLSVRSRSPQWFGEGDEKFYIDGETTPSLWGTGTEDYFCNAWGMEKGTFPAFGVTQLDGWLGDLGNTGTMYRWHLADAVRFRRSVRFVIEHAGWMSADETSTGKVEGFVERDDDFSSVAFWYQQGQPKRFATLPSAKDRRLPSIDQIIEGADLLPRTRVAGGEVHLQEGGLWTGKGQLFFNNLSGTDGSFEFDFDVPANAPARIVLPVTRSYDFGVFKLFLDGAPIPVNDAKTPEPLDFYSPTIELKELSLGDLALSPGKHTIRLECVGKNPASTGHKLGVDSVRLRQRWQIKREPLKKK